MAMADDSLQVGRVGEYEWICDSCGEGTLDHLIPAKPEIFLNRLVAITSFDSGPLTPDDNETRAGWRRVGDVLWTTPITDAELLPTAGYDEWYLFDQPIDLGNVVVFVNYTGFTVRDDIPPEADSPATSLSSLAVSFWDQLIRLRPVAFLSDGTGFNFASRDAHLFPVVLEWMRARQKTRA
jgi:hypothetical protein